MFCDECGAKNKDGAKFCRVCGVNLAYEDESPVVQKTQVPEEVEERPIISKPEPKPEPVKPQPVVTQVPDDDEDYYEEDDDDEVIEAPKASSVQTSSANDEDDEEEYYEDDDEPYSNPQSTQAAPATTNYSTQDVANNPENDKYWDDVVPAIEEEIYHLPKDIITLFAAAAVFTIVVVIIMVGVFR